VLPLENSRNKRPGSLLRSDVVVPEPEIAFSFGAVRSRADQPIVSEFAVPTVRFQLTSWGICKFSLHVVTSDTGVTTCRQPRDIRSVKRRERAGIPILPHGLSKETSLMRKRSPNGGSYVHIRKEHS